MKRYILLAAVAALLAGCNKQTHEGVCVNPEENMIFEEPVCIDVKSGERISYEEFMGGEDTKTIYETWRRGRMTYQGPSPAIYTYASYDDTRGDKYPKIEHNPFTYHYADMTHMYTIYSFMNVFKSQDEAERALSSLTKSEMDEFTYRFEDTDYTIMHGFPAVCRKTDSYQHMQPWTMTKLACQVKIVFDNIRDIPDLDWDMHAEFSNFRFQLQGSPNTIKPFAKEGFSVRSEDDVWHNDDFGNDYDNLEMELKHGFYYGGHDPIYLYLLENMMGDLMPDNDDPTKKEPENLRDEYKKRVSYIEIVSDVDIVQQNEVIRSYKDIHYRLALGLDNTKNFDCPRNYCLQYRIDLKDFLANAPWDHESRVYDPYNP